tara:strand:+ start:642 stop:1058 length:417 start_codon:yes stop_codon:yes gene_type:complete
MIDNPLPDQTMQEMDKVHAAWEFEELCKDHAFKLAQDNFVYEELIGDFQEWFFLYCIDHSEDEYARSFPDDKDLIDEWWSDEGDLYDDYISPYEDYDPTPDGDSPYSDAEYIITPEERDRKALESKRESHGRGNPFNW